MDAWTAPLAITTHSRITTVGIVTTHAMAASMKTLATTTSTQLLMMNDHWIVEAPDLNEDGIISVSDY